MRVKTTLTSETEEMTIQEVYDSLIGNKSAPLTMYEFYNTNENKFIKPVVDIDMEHYKKIVIDDMTVINDTMQTLKEIFGDDSNVIHTSDHRVLSMKGGKKTKTYKKSYHFIIDNKKINPLHLGQVMRDNMDKFKHKIDTRIYRNGENKFRLPYTRKEPILETRNAKKKNLFMITSLDESVENFKKYCLTNVTGLTEVVIKLEKKEMKEKVEPTGDVCDICELDYREWEKILAKYKHYPLDKMKNYTWLCDIDSPCPFGQVHASNKRFLVLNFLTNSIYIKCHSAKCKDKMKMVRDNFFPQLREFSLSVFKRLEFYNFQKKYLEKRVIYLSDVALYKQIKINKHNNKYLEDIVFTPIGKSNTIIVKDGEPTETIFDKMYFNDKYKKIYKNTTFYPNLKDSDKNYYNEFQGFGYEKILQHDIDKKEVVKNHADDLNFYLHYIKMYFCDNNQEVFDYFVSLLSFYIKYPYLLNHIILILYSNEHGAGKSSFLKFLMRLIGVSYCETVEMEEVLEKHSNVSYKKIINVIEEMEYNKNTNYAKKLKNRCQAETTILNEKNLPMRTVDNYVHYIETTNETRSNPLEPNDRRHFPLEFKKIYGNVELINKVDDLYFNDEFIYTFGNYLRNRPEPFDFKRVNNWENKRPKTELFKMMIKRDSIDVFITKILRYEYHNDKTIKSEDYYDYYVKSVLEPFSIVENQLVIKKNRLFDMYERKTDNKFKYQKDNFFREIINLRKFVIPCKINGDNYVGFDITKCRNHLKLNEKEITVLPVLRLIHDERLPMKIKIEEINEIIN